MAIDGKIEKRALPSKTNLLKILGLCKESKNCSKKYFNFENIDLNNDGFMDVIIEDRSPGSCGSGGCWSIIGLNTTKGIKKVGEIFHLTLEPTDKIFNGFKILKRSFYDYSTTPKSEKYENVKWDGKKYQWDYIVLPVK